MREEPQAARPRVGQARGPFALLVLCFFLSGFAALLYETAWSREFASIFGTSELAVVAVLAAYMAGLALGSAAAARWVVRVRRPARVYGFLEGGIALGALLVPFAIQAATSLYIALFGGNPELQDAGWIGGLFPLLSTFLILLPCTFCMGATLPLLARQAVRRQEELGQRVAILYAVNTFGAVAGTLCAGFLLLPSVGLRQTIYVGAGVNLLVFLVILAATRSLAWDPPAAESRTAALAAAGRWVLPVIALSGMVTFGYEVVWMRLLVHLLGGSTYSFATMLATFLAGIALGSTIAAPLASTRRRAAVGLATAELGMGVATLLAFSQADRLPDLAMAFGVIGLHNTLAQVVVSAAGMLPSTIFIGATLPFAIRLLAAEAADAGPASARVYAWNTLGTITGSILTGFVLLPALGFGGSVAAGVALNGVLAGVVVWRAGLLPRVATLLLFAAGAVPLLLPPGAPWKLLRTSALGGGILDAPVRYYEVGRSATVLLVEDRGGWQILTNGLPESRIRGVGAPPGELVVSGWLGILPVLARPETESMMVIGLGGGRTLEAVPRSVERIDVVELESAVTNANREIGAERARDPLVDPRVRVVTNDARSALGLTDRRYDAIVSQPSHPWSAGASHLYTREFFEQVEEHLTPGGVFVQWVGVAFVDGPLLRSLVATLLDVFPNLRVYRPAPGGILFLASNRPLSMQASSRRALESVPADLARYGIHVPEDEAVALYLDTTQARRFAEGADRIHDDHNILASRSPRLGAKRLGPSGANQLMADYDPLPSMLEELDVNALLTGLAVSGQGPRVRGIVRALPDESDRASARGWFMLAGGRFGRAVEHFEESIRLAPSAAAESGLLYASLLAGRVPTVAPASELDRVVAVALTCGVTQRLDACRARDAELARVPRSHPMYPRVAVSRVQWRVVEGDPAQAREAVEILDAAYSGRWEPLVLLLRAQAGAAAQRPEVALNTLAELAWRTPRLDNRDALEAGAYEVLKTLPASEEVDRVRSLFRGMRRALP